MTRTVHTTMQPDRAVEVDDAEYLDLLRSGLLIEDEHPADDDAQVEAHADLHPDLPPSEVVSGAADTAALDQSNPDPTEPDNQETPA